MIWLLFLACVSDEASDENLARELCVLINSDSAWTEEEYRSDGLVLVSEDFSYSDATNRTEYTYMEEGDWRIASTLERIGDDETLTEFDWSTDQEGHLVASQYIDYDLVRVTTYRADGYLLEDILYSDPELPSSSTEVIYESPTSWKRQTVNRYDYDYVGAASLYSSLEYEWDGLDVRISQGGSSYRLGTYREDGKPISMEFYVDGEFDNARASTYRTDTSWQLLHFVETAAFSSGNTSEDWTTYTWFDCDLMSPDM